MDVVAVVSVVDDVVVDVDVVVVSDVSLRSKPISSKERKIFRSNLTDRNFIDPKPKLFFFAELQIGRSTWRHRSQKKRPIFSKHFATVKNYDVFCGIARTVAYIIKFQRRYLWRASIEIYLALYDGVNTTS